MTTWGDCEFGDLLKMQKALEDLEKNKLNRFYERCAHELVQRLLSLVIKKTPVGRRPDNLTKDAAEWWSGYVGGTLRRSWTAKIRRYGYGIQITIENPVEYASYVEEGHRQTPGRFVPAIGKSLKSGFVPGQHMLQLSLQELERIAPALLERKIEAFLKEALENGGS